MKCRCLRWHRGRTRSISEHIRAYQSIPACDHDIRGDQDDADVHSEHQTRMTCNNIMIDMGCLVVPVESTRPARVS